MFLYFLLLSGFCVPTCASRLQFYKPIGFQVPNLITSFFHPTLSPQASEEWCTKSLTSRTLHRGKKDGMPACRGIFAMISFSSGYCKIYAIALFFGYWTCPWKKQYVKHACWAVGATLFVTFVFGFPPLLCCPDWLDKLWCFPIIIGTIDS